MDPRVVRMSDSLWDELADEAAARDLSTAEYVRQLLEHRHATDPNTPPNTQSNPDSNTPNTIPDPSNSPNTRSNTEPDTPDSPNTRSNTEPNTTTRDDTLVERLEEHNDRIRHLEERLDTLTADTADPESTETSTTTAEDQDTPAQETPPRGNPSKLDGFLDRFDEAGDQITIDWDQTDYVGNADDKATVKSAIAQFSYPHVTTPDQLYDKVNRDPSFDHRTQFLHTVLRQVEFVEVPETPTGEYRITADLDGDL